ncbi:unnamed protein product [Calypogeia fissa]
MNERTSTPSPVVGEHEREAKRAGTAGAPGSSAAGATVCPAGQRRLGRNRGSEVREGSEAGRAAWGNEMKRQGYFYDKEGSPDDG